MVYMTGALLLHEGHFYYPNAFTLDAFKEWFWSEIVGKVLPAVAPTLKATKIYMGYVVFSFILAYIMPGPVVEGLPIPSLKGKRVSWVIGKSIPSFYFSSSVNQTKCHVFTSWNISAMVCQLGILHWLSRLFFMSLVSSVLPKLSITLVLSWA